MDKVRPTRHGSGGKILVSGIGIAVVVICALGYFYLQRQSYSLNRPQEPKGPFPYLAEDVSFRNTGANITLSGTITLPSGSQSTRHPAVILISGYGPQNRDAEWFGHKPFLVIADHLTRQGIAVLRFDDRGFGRSSGDYHAGTSMDFSTDVESAIQFLKTRNEIDTTSIGLIGHSDGAMIAPIVAARVNDVSFIVMLAGPGIAGGELMVKRQELWARKAGKSEDEINQSTQYMKSLVSIVVNAQNDTTLTEALTKLSNDAKEQIPNDQIPPGISKDEFISQQVKMLTSPWFKYFFSYDPQSDLRKVKCAVLAITGDKDIQAPSNINLPAIEFALTSAGNKDFTVKELTGLNHMFQECETGMVDEYTKIDQTFSPKALHEISQFVLEKSHVEPTKLHE